MSNPYDILTSQDAHNVKWDTVTSQPTIASLSADIINGSTVTVNASGTVSAGQIALMDDSGYAQPVEFIPYTLGTVTEPESATFTYYGSGYVEISGGMVLVAGQYKYDGSNDGWAVAGLLQTDPTSGYYFDWGTPTEYHDVGTNYYSDFEQHPFVDNKIVLSYAYNVPYVVVATPVMSGGNVVLEYGTAVTPFAVYAPNVSSVYHPIEQQVVIIFSRNTAQSYCAAASLSGDTVTFPGGYSYFGGGFATQYGCYDSVNNKIILIYKNVSDSDNIYARTATLSGSVLTYGTEYALTNTGSHVPGKPCYDPVAERVFAPYRNNAAPGDAGYYSILSVDGDTITVESSGTYHDGYKANGYSDYVSSAGKIVVAYFDGINNKFRVGRISGNEITFEDPVVFDSSANSEPTINVSPDGEKVIFVTKATNVPRSTVYTLDSSTLTSQNFLGIAEEQIPDSSSIVLLIHSDNDNNDPVVVDSSSVGHIITTGGVASHNTDQAKFGSSSLGANVWGDANHFSIPAHTSFDILHNDFTISLWHWSGTGSVTWFSKYIGYNAPWHFYANTVRVFESDNTMHSVGLGSFVTSQWNHIVVVRDGNILRTYLGGIQQNTLDLTGLTMKTWTTETLYILEEAYDSIRLDEIRIDKGRCLYPDGTTFDVPTEPTPQLSGRVGVLGRKVTNQSGLVVPNKYYANLDGSLTTTNTGIEVGKASSDTDLIITG